jgi:ubiquinone biosynthesis protein Coq4
MKTIRKKSKLILDYLIKLHLKTSSWVAGIIGPMVFDIGSKDKNWNLCTTQLLQYPEGSLGKTLGEFLKKHHVELLVGAEYHDVHHVLFDYSISFKDEVALQFFLHGNGNKSIASISTRIGAWCLLPTEWKYLKASYERGKKCKDVSVINFKTMLHQDLTQVKASLFA